MPACTSTAAGLKILTTPPYADCQVLHGPGPLGIRLDLAEQTSSDAQGEAQRPADFCGDHARQGEVAGHGFQTADVAAAAAAAVGIDGDVPDFSSEAAMAGHDLAAAHDGGPQAAGGVDRAKSSMP